MEIVKEGVVDAYWYWEEVMKRGEGLLEFRQNLIHQGYYVCVMQDKAGNHTTQFPYEEFSR